MNFEQVYGKIMVKHLVKPHMLQDIQTALDSFFNSLPARTREDDDITNEKNEKQKLLTNLLKKVQTAHQIHEGKNITKYQYKKMHQFLGILIQFMDEIEKTVVGPPLLVRLASKQINNVYEHMNTDTFDVVHDYLDDSSDEENYEVFDLNCNIPKLSQVDASASIEHSPARKVVGSTPSKSHSTKPIEGTQEIEMESVIMDSEEASTPEEVPSQTIVRVRKRNDTKDAQDTPTKLKKTKKSPQIRRKQRKRRRFTTKEDELILTKLEELATEKWGNKNHTHYAKIREHVASALGVLPENYRYDTAIRDRIRVLKNKGITTLQEYRDNKHKLR